jgi:hypothetical protein
MSYGSSLLIVNDARPPSSEDCFLCFVVFLLLRFLLLRKMGVLSADVGVLLVVGPAPRLSVSGRVRQERDGDPAPNDGLVAAEAEAPAARDEDNDSLSILSPPHSGGGSEDDDVAAIC